MSKTNTAQVGEWGEQLVQLWLQQEGWQIVARRWHCRWGELDLVAHQPQDNRLAFVEVKTRQRNSLDQQGLAAIALGKQTKILRTANLFLGQYPQYAEAFCQFDVALVSHRLSVSSLPIPKRIELGQPYPFENSVLMLDNYIESAFEAFEC